MFALSGFGLTGLIALGLVGFVLRDRTAWLALLLYLPLVPLGAAAVVLDLASRGRSFRRGPRFSLTTLGLVAVACSGWTMMGRGPASSSTTVVPDEEIRLLHWNVLWGGHSGGDGSWNTITAEIVARRPDVVLLSEAPPAARLDSLLRTLGPNWSLTRVEHIPGRPYWYRLVALSRWPVEPGRFLPLRNGAAMDVRIQRPGGPVRILMVDGQSQVTQLRTPMLQDVAQICRRETDAGDPFDVLAGDFNAVSRSLGFESIQTSGDGYHLASRSSTGWRGTWPHPLSLFDIDHVWTRSGISVVSCNLFANRECDHRGQLVRLRVPTTSARDPKNSTGF